MYPVSPSAFFVTFPSSSMCLATMRMSTGQYAAWRRNSSPQTSCRMAVWSAGGRVLNRSFPRARRKLTSRMWAAICRNTRLASGGMPQPGGMEGTPVKSPAHERDVRRKWKGQGMVWICQMNIVVIYYKEKYVFGKHVFGKLVPKFIKTSQNGIELLKSFEKFK